MKLCVFPMSSLHAYYKKGQLPLRYFNPKNIFDEVHVISMFDNDIEEEKVKAVAGTAILKIHVTGKVNQLNKNSKKKEIIELIRTIKPDVMIAYNPLLPGWMAAQVKKELNIPLIISIHGEYEKDIRFLARKNREYKTWLKLLYSKITLERFSTKNADEVIIVYEYLREYAEKNNAKNINLIYSRIYPSQFLNKKPVLKKSKPVIICVGNLIKGKNQECLIKAIKDLDVNLLLIGNGPEYENLVKLVRDLNIEKKVRFELSIPHEKIQEYYHSADIFAQPLQYGGFSIPSIEAAMSGLPVILPKQKPDHNMDIINDFVLLVENNPDSFKEAIQKVLHDNELRKNLIKKGLETTKKINGDLMEEKEKELYLKLLQKK